MKARYVIFAREDDLAWTGCDWVDLTDDAHAWRLVARWKSLRGACRALAFIPPHTRWSDIRIAKFVPVRRKRAKP